MTPQNWYIFARDAVFGPFEEPEVLKILDSGKFSWVDFAWPEGALVGARRLCEIAAFRDYLPAAPDIKFVHEVRERVALNGAPRSPETKSISSQALPEPRTKTDLSLKREAWFIQFDGSEFGPLRFDEVRVLMESGRLSGPIFAWKRGLENWLPLSSIPEFSELTQTLDKRPKSNERDLRKWARHSLVATVAIRDGGSEQVIGICGDVSIGGMQILSESIPISLVVGAEIELRVNPSGVAGLRAFEVKVKVARINRNKGAFGVQFISLPSLVAQGLEAYLERLKARNVEEKN